MASIVIQGQQPINFSHATTDSLALDVAHRCIRCFAIGQNTDLYLAHLSTKDHGCKIVCRFVIRLCHHAHCFLFPKVVLKKIRDGFVEKRPKTKCKIAEVCRPSVSI